MRTCIVLGLSLLVAAPAWAADVTCESKGRGRTECPMDTQGDVQVKRQLSKSPCTEGVSWGLSKHAVWVEQGCRAVFSNASDNAAAAPTASGGLPLFNATCPGGLDVHGDQGGPVYVNGKEATLKKSNDNYYEAKDAATGTVISLSKNPDGSLSVSYTGRKGANGICQLR